MSSIKRVKLGSQGLVVPAIGLGCMGMTSLAGMDIYRQADRYDKSGMASIDQ